MASTKLLICLGLVALCEGATQKIQDNQELSQLSLLSQLFQPDFICNILPSPHRVTTFGLDIVQQTFQHKRKPKDLFDEEEEAFMRKNNGTYSVASLRVYNSTHVALTLDTVRPCVILSDKDNVKFEKYQKTSGDSLSTSELEVQWKFGKSEPILIEHDSSDMIILVEKSGWTRVLYDDILYQRILDQLENNPALLPKETKVFLMEDQIDLGGTTRVNYSRALDYTRYIHKEQDSYVWTYASLVFHDISQKFSSHPNYHLFEKYVSSKTVPLLKSIGWKEEMVKISEEDKHNREVLRSNLLTWNCKMGGVECEQYAKEFIDNWKSNQTVNPMEIYSPQVIYKYVEISGAEAYIVASQIDNNFSDPSMIYMLSGSRDPYVFSKLLAFNVDVKSTTPPFDHSQLLRGIADNPVGRPQFLDILSRDFKVVTAQNGTAGVVSLLDHFANSASTQQELEGVQTFIKTHEKELQSESGKLDTVLEDIMKNIAWTNSNAEDISIWLKNQHDINLLP